MITLLLVFFSFCATTHHLHATQTPQNHPYLNFSPVANPTFNNTPNYYNYNTNNNTNTNNSTINATITCTSMSFSYALALALRDYMLPWFDTAKNTFNKTNYKLLTSLIHTFLWDHRYSITGGMLLGSYITTSLLLLSDYNFFCCKERWCQWKCSYNFEELCALPQQQLTKALLITINKRHCNKHKPTDMNHPLITFISDINNEIYRINRYIKITLTQKTLRLIKFFPTNETKIKRAEQLLTRAHFIKHLFLSWLAEYNMTSSHASAL